MLTLPKPVLYLILVLPLGGCDRPGVLSIYQFGAGAGGSEFQIVEDHQGLTDLVDPDMLDFDIDFEFHQVLAIKVEVFDVCTDIDLSRFTHSATLRRFDFILLGVDQCPGIELHNSNIGMMLIIEKSDIPIEAFVTDVAWGHWPE